jgi:hypothetical protein
MTEDLRIATRSIPCAYSWLAQKCRRRCGGTLPGQSGR